ncbi:MAG: ATP-binding protein [bacterium]|nr:ATP-binding protein [Candidatus Limimorpha caballi]
MNINRDYYLNKLINARGIGMIKILTGVRRCGKSYLLFTIFKEWLMNNGVREDHIIAINLENRANKELRDPDNLLAYIHARMIDEATYFVLLDEVQLVSEFVDVLNSLLHVSNAETYVTGSNSRFLSKDVVTEFRGRGWEIRLYPLSFKEFMSVFPGDKITGWEQYVRYGGLPQILNYRTEKEKQEFLQSIWKTVYLSDVVGRYKLRNRQLLDELLQVVASQVGSSVNPANLSNTFRSSAGKTVSALTVAKWLEHLEDSFLIERAQRYDIRGKHYIGTLPKYFFVDPGIRNSILQFRQMDKGHLMENVVYTELRRRGGLVDVGQIEYRSRQPDGSQPRKQLEVDFVVNEGGQRTYYQSAYTLYDDEQVDREKRPMLQIHDSFRKVLLTSDVDMPWNDEDGILHLGLFNFLLEQ